MSRSVGMVLVGVILVAVLALSWFFLLSPIMEDIKTVDDGIEKARVELQEAQTQLAQAESTREKGRKNQARLMALAKMVPPDQEIPGILLQIQGIASKAGIDFMSISPGQPTTALDVRMIPLSIKFTGDFDEVVDFISRAESMVAWPGRLLAVKHIKFTIMGSETEKEADSSAGTDGNKAPEEGETETALEYELREGESPKLEIELTLYAFDSAVREAGQSGGQVPSGPAPGDEDPAEAM